MKIIIFGSNDNEYEILERNAKRAAEELGISSTIERIRDFTTVYGTGTFKTIGFVIDGKIKAIGKVPTVEEIKKYILKGEKDNG